MALQRNNLGTILKYALFPELVSTLVGIIVGTIAYEEGAGRTLSQNLLFWIININTGAVAHQLAWLIMFRVFKLKREEETSTLRVIWKPTMLGITLTFIFVFLLNRGYQLPRDVVVLMFFQVLAICVIVHIFLFQFKFYATSGGSTSPRDSDTDLATAESADDEPIIDLIVNERIEKVHLSRVSHIKVEDHYCTVVYQKHAAWQQWTVYGKLKTFEKRYSAYLVRINRSVLVNPNMVVKVEKNAGKHLITMKGDIETPFILSSSQKHALDQLVPVIG